MMFYEISYVIKEWWQKTIRWRICYIIVGLVNGLIKKLLDLIVYVGLDLYGDEGFDF